MYAKRSLKVKIKHAIWINWTCPTVNIFLHNEIHINKRRSTTFKCDRGHGEFIKTYLLQITSSMQLPWQRWHSVHSRLNFISSAWSWLTSRWNRSDSLQNLISKNKTETRERETIELSAQKGAQQRASWGSTWRQFTCKRLGHRGGQFCIRRRSISSWWSRPIHRSWT